MCLLNENNINAIIKYIHQFFNAIPVWIIVIEYSNNKYIRTNRRNLDVYFVYL